MSRRWLCYGIPMLVGTLVLFCAAPNDPYNKPYKIEYMKSDMIFTVGVPVVADTPKVGGAKPLSFRINPGLPRGLDFDTATAVISGTPIDTLSKSAYTVTAFNSYGTYSVTIFITVNPAAPKTLVYDLDTAVYIINKSIFPNNATYTGGAPTSYVSDKPLPEGLRLDATKGTIYGTPTKISPQTAYTITGRNPSGSASTVVVITVDSGTVIDTTVSRPTGLKALRIDTQKVHVSWNEVDKADSYIISRSVAGRTIGYQTITSVTDTFFLDAARLNGFYYVRAKRATYTSVSSDTVEVLDTINKVVVNRPPAITSNLASRSINVNDSTEIVINATDPDTNQTLTMRIENLDSLRALFGADSLSAIRWVPGGTTGTITFKPGSNSGTYRFTVWVSDGKDSVSGTIVVYVGNVNRAPEWKSQMLKVSVNDNATWGFTLADSCVDPDMGDLVSYRFVSDSQKCSLNGGRFSFAAGMLDTVLQRVVAIEASDGKLADTLQIQITIVPVYYALTTNSQNGSVSLLPSRTSYRMGESVRLTGVPFSGYEFVRWTGDIDTAANPVTIVMDAPKSITANFRRYTITDCVTLNPGSSINAKIQELSPTPGGTNICPAQGKYDSNTIEVEGKVTVEVNVRQRMQ